MNFDTSGQGRNGYTRSIDTPDTDRRKLSTAGGTSPEQGVHAASQIYLPLANLFVRLPNVLVVKLQRGCRDHWTGA